MINKLLTIVVPVYNTEEFLGRCIESLTVEEELMNQLEILLVIDGSPDNSINIAKYYERKYPDSIKVIEKENGGHGSTVNKGLELASGKYFRILDSDDWFDNKNFSIFISRLINEDVDIVMTHITREYVYKNESVFQSIENIEFDTVIDAETFNYDTQPIEFFAMARCTFKTSKLRAYKLHLLERTFYEEALLHVFPLIYLEKFIFYDLQIYHYFLGRVGQSVAVEVSLRNNGHWQKLIKQVIDFYDEHKLKLNSNKDLFFRRILATYIGNQYAIMNNFDYHTARVELKKWNEYVISIPYYSQIINYKQKLYKLLPYFVFRFLYKARVYFNRLKS